MGLICPDDQLCCTQASQGEYEPRPVRAKASTSQGECVAGEGYHPADVSSFCLVRLSSIRIYFSGSFLVEGPVVIVIAREDSRVPDITQYSAHAVLAIKPSKILCIAQMRWLCF